MGINRSEQRKDASKPEEDGYSENCKPALDKIIFRWAPKRQELGTTVDGSTMKVIRKHCQCELATLWILYTEEDRSQDQRECGGIAETEDIAQASSTCTCSGDSRDAEQCS